MQIHFQAPSVEELNPQFDQYQIESFIAKGGMGAVYLATQYSLDRKVAIKILPDEFGENQSHHDSFAQEAKAMAKVNHGNLVSVYDFGKIGQMLYIVMEYVPGKTLFQLYHKKAVPRNEAAKLIIAICNGLHVAHQADLIHRDIKPANILVNDQRECKLVDFGLATLHSEHQYDGETIYGTPGYTAPEVLQNPAGIDFKADIFSVGVVFYELLTGKLPDPNNYQAPSTFESSSAIFDDIILRAMQASPTHRSGCAKEMANSIAKALEFSKSSPSQDRSKNSPIQLTAANQQPSHKRYRQTNVTAARVGGSPPLPMLKSGNQGKKTFLITAICVLIACISIGVIALQNPDTSNNGLEKNQVDNTPVKPPIANTIVTTPVTSPGPKPLTPIKEPLTSVDKKHYAHHFSFENDSTDEVHGYAIKTEGSAVVRDGELHFPDGNGYALLPPEVFSPAKGATHFTIEFWAKSRNPPSEQGNFLFCWMANPVKEEAFSWIGFSPIRPQRKRIGFNLISFQRHTNRFKIRGATMKQTPFPTEHQHFVFKIDFRSNMMHCYVNGELAGKSRPFFAARDIATNKLFIGRHPTNPKTGFIGSIRDIKIHNKTIERGVIETFYQQGAN